MWPLSFVAHFCQTGNVTPLLLVCRASNDMTHVFDMVSPGNLFFVLWVLSDVKRHAVYFDTKALRDVPSVSTQEAIAHF